MPPKKKTAATPSAKRQKKAISIAADYDFDDDDIMSIPEDDSAAVAALPPPPIPSEPIAPITQSYTYASPVPPECSKIDPSNPSIKVPCVLGVDEAGRGPVLGPLVYGIAYCPVSYADELKSIGFADSKALTAERRDTLLSALIHHESHLGWAVRVMSPQDISAGMLRRRPVNLNAQSSQATVSLIAGVLDSGVDVTEIYVDTVGDPKSYQRLLSSHFPRHPHIKWTVTSKADAIYPIVGAASIAAKVTRDRCVEGWMYAEQQQRKLDVNDEPKVLGDATNHTPSSHLDTPSESKKRKSDSHTDDDTWSNMGPLGSGYPGDPNTVAYLKRTLDPVFGWPGLKHPSRLSRRPLRRAYTEPFYRNLMCPVERRPEATRSNGSTNRSPSRSSSVPPPPSTPRNPTQLLSLHMLQQRMKILHSTSLPCKPLSTPT
ncbi:ribonuclease subunit [Pseudozyma hubeiensis SY62]|uniref:Ribonuclease n=1 Tax=Pseudozyma hubeiensis (strain SY62) TaxID=1305764 RepID=R9NZP4_PSEHS|nr:ribonuclease subunit [Pseudozyma hubeiensis SY62]GAC94328.1 ribonuclease subunit [Pseudozyma hubeiensis SY62]